MPPLAAAIVFAMLRSYLYQVQEQLQYVLRNLDVENMSDEMRTKLQNL